jgi:hypothetical protein
VIEPRDSLDSISVSASLFIVLVEPASLVRQSIQALHSMAVDLYRLACIESGWATRHSHKEFSTADRLRTQQMPFIQDTHSSRGTTEFWLGARTMLCKFSAFRSFLHAKRA